MPLHFNRLALTGMCAMLMAGLTACGTEPVKSLPGQDNTPPAARATATEGPLMKAASASWVGDRPIVVRPDFEGLGAGRNPDAILITGTLGSGFGAPRGPAGPHTGGLEEHWFLVFRTSALQAGRASAPECGLPVEGHPDYCMALSAKYGIGEPSSSVYTPDSTSVYDAGRQNLLRARGDQLLEAKMTGGALKAGEAFEVILEPLRPLLTRTKIQSGDVAVIWLADPDNTLQNLRITTAMPAHVFLPVKLPPGQ